MPLIDHAPTRHAPLSADPDDPTVANVGLRREITDRFKYAQQAVTDWETEAKQDMAFGLGDQWTSEDKIALADAGRPALTFNRIKPILTIVSGYQRENSARIKVNPEGGEDRIFSEVMDRVLRQVDKWSHLADKMNYWFDDGLLTGKGWLEAVLTYDADPVKGELRFLQRTPYQVLVDPDFREYDLNEYPRAGYLFKVTRLSRAVLKQLYPQYANLIDGFVTDTDDVVENGRNLIREGPKDDYGNRPVAASVVTRSPLIEESGLAQDQKFTVKEYWRPVMVDRFYVVDRETSQPQRFRTRAEADAFAAQQAFGKVIVRPVPEMHVAAMVGGFILQDTLSPFEPHYSGYPFFRFLADWTPSAETETLRVQGIVRQLKDPQREKNKARSQNLHILNTQANSGWIGDEEALTVEGWKQLEKMGSKPGITVRQKRGTQLREILPKGPNAGQIRREQDADQEFKQISAVNPDLLGLPQDTTSGRAISLRIKQAVLSLARIFSNFRYSKEILGRFILQMVPALFDGAKLEKVLGPQYMKTATDDRYPEGLLRGHLDAFLYMVGDQKYDVYVAEADANKTIRYEIFTDLVELVKAGMPIPPDLLIDYMDISNSEEVKKKIREQQALAAQVAASKAPPTQLPPGVS